MDRCSNHRTPLAMAKRPRPAIASSGKVAHTHKPLIIDCPACGSHIRVDVGKDLFSAHP